MPTNDSKPLQIYKNVFSFLQEEAQEEFGWKLVHGDVFRPPRAGMFLSVCIGMGTQIGIMIFVTLGKIWFKHLKHSARITHISPFNSTMQTKLLLISSTTYT